MKACPHHPAVTCERGCVTTGQCQEAIRIAKAEQRQGQPTKNTQPNIQDMVIADLEARKAVGLARYGTLLQPFNGRDMLMDAYQESLDLAVYLRGCLEERNQSANPPLPQPADHGEQ